MKTAAQAIREAARPLVGSSHDYDELLERIGEARIVLLGEATHGTHQFYLERSRLSRRLIEERGFVAVALEADWPAALGVGRWVQGEGERNAVENAFAGFQRFPQWMWRNPVFLDLVGELRDFNARPDERPLVGVFGLDLYSLHDSIRAVLEYLDKVNPQAAQVARERYSCFDQYGEDPQDYGFGAGYGLGSCEQEVVAELADLHRRRAELVRLDGQAAQDEFFYAEQNARVAASAEAYYREMFRGRANTWNLRDRHMFETLRALILHLERTRGSGKVIVWAHNSHLGDARATYMRQMGELNLGQLVREHYGGQAVNVGFTTHTGTVTAASDWGGQAQRMRVRPSLEGSYERLLHQAAEDGPANFWLDLREESPAAEALEAERLERAIGVIYRPQTERMSHYFEARLPRQFDFVLHLDETQALEPLERSSTWEQGELPETYPTGV